VAAQFANSTGAIVVGNGGRTIWNGFANDLFTNGSDGVQLYTNEINSVFATTVPEPSSLAIFGIGAYVAGIGAARRRRREMLQETTA
jgi:hypothetical protein